MTSELICPNCNREARFREVYGPGDSLHLECTICGAATDDAELALAQEPESIMVSYCDCGDYCEWCMPEVIQ